MGHERGLQCWGDAIDYAEKTQQKIDWALCDENESNAERRNWLKLLDRMPEGPMNAPACITPRYNEPQGKDHLKSHGNESDQFFGER
jgi:hypothetical protein